MPRAIVTSPTAVAASRRLWAAVRQSMFALELKATSPASPQLLPLTSTL